MKTIITAVCCAALLGSVSLASAQTTGPAGQDTAKSSPMNSNAKMMSKKKKMMMMKKKGMMKDGMSDGGMKKM